MTTVFLKSDPKKKRSKYRNVRTEVDGIWFDSAAEAGRWSSLKLLQRTGKIADLKRQIEFRLEVAGILVTKYKADFTYMERGVGYVVEDVKSKPTTTQLFKVKARLMKAIYHIDILITGKGT